MWEGFKVEQIVLANTGMENAPSAAVEAVPKLAVSSAGSVGIAALCPQQSKDSDWGLGLLSLQPDVLNPE